MNTIERTLPEFLRQSEAVFSAFGFLTPLAFADRGQCVEVYTLNFGSKEAVRKLQAMLQEWADKGELAAFLLSGECWESNEPGAKAFFAEHGSLDGYEGERQEVVQLFYGSPDGSCVYRAPISRLKAGEEKAAFLG